ncbi:MAG: DUF3307 domain-containing protein [Rhodobacteraceae bacterium]|nr:MAG: DUF3307 domain-containing protein [Paracoccaceae bacterium]
MSGGTVLLALALFQLKHYLADFQWQSAWMVQTKGRYGHLGGVAHAGLHGALSLPVLLLVAPSMPLLIALLVLGEVVLHYHVDWLKSRLSVGAGIDQNDSAYWHLLGLDQAAHQLTYLAIVAMLVMLG